MLSRVPFLPVVADALVVEGLEVGAKMQRVIVKSK
jgi:hypothetical protein